MDDIDTILDAAFAAAMATLSLPAPKPQSKPSASENDTAPPHRPHRPLSWCEARNVAFASSRWRSQVRLKLLDGFGIEDIAIWLDCHPSHIRAEVSRLREAGMLAKWWPN